jgi:glycosyltransferase involved in cell wall biosynthesis
MNPLVSILIPAYNAEKWIGYTLESAVNQTWPRKEIIVVDDGSGDRTAEVARRYHSNQVAVISKANEGAATARNRAYGQSQGDYIQWLDADDILSPDKIERQVAAMQETGNNRILASSPWSYFFFRANRARFVPNSLWQDLAPVEWLLRKMGENLHMGNSTWLVSREIAEAAGPHDECLEYDDDGEYFCRVLLASEGTRFVPEGRVFYRASGPASISYIGNSDKKKESLLRSMKLHVQYLRSLEESERVRKACLSYFGSWSWAFYPDRPDLFAELKTLAEQLGGQLDPPRLSWKYAWIESLFGRRAARQVEVFAQEKKASLIRGWDKAMFEWERRKGEAEACPSAPGVAKREK